MTDVRIDVQGARELRTALKRAEAELPVTLRTANFRAAEVVVKAARPRTPRKTGRLQDSLRALASQRSGRARAGGGGVAYAAAIHWGRKVGNVGSPPGNHPGRNVIIGRPFLSEAATREHDRVIDQYELIVRQIAELIERA